MACQILTVCMTCNIPCQHSLYLCLGDTSQIISTLSKYHSLTTLSHRGHGISRALHSNTIHIPIQTLMTRQILTMCMTCNIPCQHSLYLCLGDTSQIISTLSKYHSLTTLSHRGHGISRALHSNTIHIPIQTLMRSQIIPHRLIQRLCLLLSKIRCQLTAHINILNLIIEHLHTPCTRNL